MIIIEDPIKPQDAQSKSVRDKTIQWYENTLLSRLDDKVHGIVVVMQRLQLDDLAGHLLERGGFEHPAIAEKKETIQLGNGRAHTRHIGTVLDPVREPLSALERQRDKIMRLTAQAAQFHAGLVHFREDAPWLGELMVELLGFPGVRHDDQVDSISQALAFISWRVSHRYSVEPLRL